MKTITTTNPSHRITKIMAEVRNRTFIDEFDAKVLEDILQEELNDYCRMLDEYYDEEYHNAINTTRNSAYDSGYDDGYDIGYDNGQSDGHSKSNSDGYTAV